MKMTAAQRAVLRAVASGWSATVVHDADEVLFIGDGPKDGFIARRKTVRAVIDAGLIKGDGTKVWITDAGRVALAPKRP
jgi:hypothetical protein